MKKALNRHGSLKTIITDGLRSYKAAMNELSNAEKQEVGRWAKNRAENSHLPFRRRKRTMLRLRQMKSLQKFASAHASLHNHFSHERHLAEREHTSSIAPPPWRSDNLLPAKRGQSRAQCAGWLAVRREVTAPAPGLAAPRSFATHVGSRQELPFTK